MIILLVFLHCCNCSERFGLKCEFSLVSNKYFPSIRLDLIPLNTVQYDFGFHVRVFGVTRSVHLDKVDGQSDLIVVT